MPIDEKEWRPITFQGVTFPSTLMGVSVLGPVLLTTDEELNEWLWRLPICCGTEKTAPAELCARCAQKSVDLMLECHQKVIDGIRENLGPHGFDADSTYRDWINALQRIVTLSKRADGNCVWSAPSHPEDMKPADWQRLLAALDRDSARLTGNGNDEQS
jgi:hypothetical protein